MAGALTPFDTLEQAMTCIFQKKSLEALFYVYYEQCQNLTLDQSPPLTNPLRIDSSGQGLILSASFWRVCLWLLQSWELIRLEMSNTFSCPPLFLMSLLSLAMCLWAIIGNTANLRSKPSFIFADMIDLGRSAFVIETHISIPKEILPREPLLSRILANTP